MDELTEKTPQVYVAGLGYCTKDSIIVENVLSPPVVGDRFDDWFEIVNDELIGSVPQYFSEIDWEYECLTVVCLRRPTPAEQVKIDAAWAKDKENRAKQRAATKAKKATEAAKIEEAERKLLATLKKKYEA